MRSIDRSAVCRVATLALPWLILAGHPTEAVIAYAVLIAGACIEHAASQ